MHRGCRTGGQTMRITQFTFEPKINDFKLQSGVKHAPSSQSWGTFPNHVNRSYWHWLCSTRWFFFSCRALRTVLCERIDRDRLFTTLFLLCCHRWEMLVWFSLSRNTKSLTFLLTLAAHLRVSIFFALPLPYYKAPQVTLKPVKTTRKQTQNQAQKETYIKLRWFLLLLNSDRTELGWTTEIISFSVQITCTTLPFILHPTSS